MLRKEVAERLKSADGIIFTKVLKQHWKERKYSYLDSPRPDFGLMLLLSGEVNFVTEEETLSAQTGNLVFLPKGSRYEAVFPGEAEDYLTSFDMDVEGLSFRAPIKLSDKASFASVDAFRELVENNFDENHTKLRSLGLLYLLLDAVVNDTEDETLENRGVMSRARELLSKNEDISVGEVAKACAVSESGLRRIFKEQTGITPTEYRTQVKLKRAAYLLESTELSVNEISERLNFFDAAYFCKVFRRRIGITPREYRQNKKL